VIQGRRRARTDRPPPSGRSGCSPGPTDSRPSSGTPVAGRPRRPAGARRSRLLRWAKFGAANSASALP
jgi:hypothetical protein